MRLSTVYKVGCPKEILENMAAKLKERFSAREIQVLSMWLLGHSMSYIGSRLFISPRTVESHLSHIKDKLQHRKREAIISLLISKQVYDDLVLLAKEILTPISLVAG